MGLGRLTVIGALCAAGCVAQNPAFSDTTGGTGGDGAPATSGTKGGPTGEVADTSGLGTSSPGEGSGTSGSSGDATSSSTSSGSSSGIRVGETTTDPSAPVLVWLTAAVTGDFELDPADLCEEGLVSLDAMGACNGEPLFVVGRDDEPLPELPRNHPFLADGEVIAVDSGALLAESFEALAESTVSPSFVTDLSGPPPKIAATLIVWWGTTVVGGNDSCGDWTISTGEGSTRMFAAEQTSGSPTTSPCESPHRILCACPG